MSFTGSCTEVEPIFCMGGNFEAKFFSLAYLTKKFAYGFDRMLLETSLCQVSNETDGSKWSQNATLDFYTIVLASFLR